LSLVGRFGNLAYFRMSVNTAFTVFLRALEYFKGILFITTNRVGTFDDAFISRIHVSLYYPPLVDRDRVLIWESNFRRLEKDAAIKIPEATRVFTRYDEGLKLIKWNGREIRNGSYFYEPLLRYTPIKGLVGSWLTPDLHQGRSTRV
jgi:hypothetical protein